MTSPMVSGYDHHDANQMLDPYSDYSELRREHPVARSDRHGGYWVLSRYHDVIEAAGNHRHLCSGQGIAVPAKIDLRVEPQEADPPRHTAVRALMTPWFSMPAVAKMEQLVRTVSGQLLTTLAGRDEFDLAQEYAAPFASLVMLRLLGFPEELEHRLQADIEGLLHPSDANVQAEAAADLSSCVATTVARRRISLSDPSSPSPDDLVTRMLTTELDGQPVTDAEAVSFGLSLLFAGFETSANTIATAVYHLASRPDLWARLQEEPDLHLTAVEEILRYVSPVQAIGRRADGDLDIAGERIRTGETVVLLYGSANHDPDVFAEAESLDLARASNRHLAFGAGIHRCLGRHLARLELRVALGDLTTRLAGIALPSPEKIQWRFGENRGVRSLPVRIVA